MMNRFKMTAILSTRFLCAAVYPIKINSLFSVFTPKQGNPNPFIFLSSTIHTSDKHTLKLSQLSDALDCINNIHEAEALFHYMLQIKPTPSTWYFNRLFNIIVKMKHYSQVIFMFKKLILLDFPINEYIMSTVINSYGHMKEIDSSFAVLAAFLKRGYVPDIVSLTCLIKGLFLKGSVSEAVDLFKKIVRCKLCEVTECTIATVLYGLSKSGNIVDVVQLLEISEKKDWEGYNTVIDGLCKDGMDLLFRIIDRDIHPDVFSYNCLMHGLIMNGKLDFARSMLNDLASKGICPDVITYNVMIQGFCREGLFQNAKEMLEEMERAGCLPNSTTYNIIIQDCLQLHNRHKFDSIILLKQIVGRDFQLHVATFFLLLGQVRVLPQMQDICDEDSVNHLIRKLISVGAIHQMRDNDDEFRISSLIQKLYFSDRRCSIS